MADSATLTRQPGAAQSDSAYIERPCEECGKAFRAARWFVERGKGRFCSKSCAGKSKARLTPPPSNKGKCKPLAERLWPYVDRSGGPDACWPWQGTRKDTGYGHINYKGTTVKAHRAAYELSREPIPEGMVVLHECDNPPCCNPKHLRVGTQAENMLDSVKKGRMQVVGQFRPTNRHNRKFI